MMLLPQPQRMELRPGTFSLRGTTLAMDVSCGSGVFELLRELQTEISEAAGFHCPITRVNGAFAGGVFFRQGGGGEGYCMEITPNGITVEGDGYPGIFYAVQTLIQIIRQEGERLPCLTIRDAPAFRHRGFLLDVTRGSIPTMDSLMKLVDRLSFLKVNQLQLYVEHSFAFRGQSEVWAGRDALTAEEILALDAYCRRKCVELVPCMQTFGHLYEVLNTESYRGLCELENYDAPFSWLDRMLHHTLDVSNPDSLEFVKKMLDEVIPLFSSDKFNICCDETFDLGQGRSRRIAEEKGVDGVYLDFLLSIYRYVREKGKKVMFWGDILLKNPALLQKIPKDAIALNWDYSPDVTEDGVKTLAEAGFSQYVCPGTQAWNTLTPDFDAMRHNIRNMADFGVKYRADGMITTSWGDYGNINLPCACFPGMAYGAAAAWNPAAGMDAEEMDRKISFFQFGDAEARIAGLMEKLAAGKTVTWGDAANWLEKDAVGRVPWELEDYRQRVGAWSSSALLAAYRATQCSAEEIFAAGRALRDKTAFREICVSARGTVLLQLVGLLILHEEKPQEPAEWPVRPGELAVLLEEWLDDYVQVWRLSRREGELFRLQDAVRAICRIARKTGAES